MIFENIISTVDADGKPHVAPFGVRFEGDLVLVAPYKPSSTLENILATKAAVLNATDDVRVYAGALVGKPYPPLLAATHIKGVRLAQCLSHVELELVRVQDDTERPQLWMRMKYRAQHGEFRGFNRAQAAVLELCILVSRLHLLSRDKILTEKDYLKIAINKTAGELEREAWDWLEEKIARYYKENAA